MPIARELVNFALINTEIYFITIRSTYCRRCFIILQYCCSLLEPMLAGNCVKCDALNHYGFMQVTAASNRSTDTTLYGRDILPFVPDTSLPSEGVHCFTRVCYVI